MFRISFFVDDKHLASVLIQLTGMARELKVEPVINAKPKGNGVTHRFEGNLYGLAMAEVRKQGLKEVNAKIMRDIISYIGGNPNSYYHVLRHCMKEGWLRKNAKKGATSKVTYTTQPEK